MLLKNVQLLKDYRTFYRSYIETEPATKISGAGQQRTGSATLDGECVCGWRGAICELVVCPDDLLAADQEDESLNTYKATLLGTGYTHTTNCLLTFTKRPVIKLIPLYYSQ